MRAGNVTPFGEELPLVTGVAWDARTAQVALVAEMDSSREEEPWRQLLFAGSGLRHHLAGDGRAAFGPPLILVIVDDVGERTLRMMVEDLAQRYALFSRVDLNLVRHRDLEHDDALDAAIAPLLPCCREFLREGQEISRRDVQRFWDVLREQVENAALALDDMFGEFRGTAGKEVAKTLIAGSPDSLELPALTPISTITIKNLRSFAHTVMQFPQVTVVHGANGSGKSTLLEALELLWAETSQRKPWDVEASEYARHLPRDGEGDFAVTSEHCSVTSIATEPRAELARCVLTQEVSSALVNQPPEERYKTLLSLTGLEIPDLDLRTKNLLADVKRDADTALKDAGLPMLATSGSDGCGHLRKAFTSDFASRLPSAHGLVGFEQALERASAGIYQARKWTDEQAATDALLRIDGLIAQLPDNIDVANALDEAALDEAALTVRELAKPRHEAARGIRLLLDAAVKSRLPDAPPPPQGDDTTAPVPAALAVRWVAHANAVTEASSQFRTDAAGLEHAEWAQRLAAYADALDAAAATVPRDELEAFVRVRPAPKPAPGEVVAKERFLAAGFSAPVENLHELVPQLQELVELLQRQSAELDTLASDLERHPARQFSEHAARVLAAVCRYELARGIRRKGPVMRASQELVHELLQGRLAPVMRELVAALARFEWYFKPLEIPDRRQQVLLGGVSTTRDDLDARLVLNSAEKTVLGLGWFLALHLLQPANRRQVLVLDDPTAAFDAVAQASFVATLRAFVRLTRPSQIVVASHDDGLAALLADELAPVDQWPSAVARVRCQRDENADSVVTVEWSDETSRELAHEAAQLGLTEEPTLLA